MPAKASLGTSMRGRGRGRGARRRAPMACQAGSDDVDSQPPAKIPRGSVRRCAARAAAENGGAGPSLAPVPVSFARKDAIAAMGVNDVVIARMAEAATTVHNHTEFEGLLTADACEDCFQGAYDVDHFRRSIVTNKGISQSGYNLFRLNLNQWATMDTPVQMMKLNWVVDHFWEAKMPDCFPHTIVVALRTGEEPASNVGTMISPPEFAWAPVRAIENAIQNGSSDDDLQKLRKLVLSATVRFEIIDNTNDRIWRAHQLRQSEIQTGDSAKLTPLQFMFSVMSSKHMLENTLNQSLGAEQTCIEWKKHVTLATSMDEMKVGLVDAIITVWNRLMIDSDCREIVMWADNNFSPTIFDSIYKYEAVVKKAGTLENIRYVIAGLIDLVVHQGTSSGELAVRQLSGKGLPGGKGKIDMQIAKKDLCNALKDHCATQKCTSMYDEMLLVKLSNWAVGIDRYRIAAAIFRSI